MVGSFRERKVQLSLADERLEVLIPEGVWLPLHQLRQATQHDEPPLATLQHDIDEHLAIGFALGWGTDAIPSGRERNASESGSRSSTTGKDSCSEIRQPSGSRFSAKFGSLGQKRRLGS